MNAYNFGASVRLSAEFSNASGTLTDPTIITLKTEDPSGIEDTYTDAVKDSTGLYHRDITVSKAGIWHWRWIAEGAVSQVDEGEFSVNPTVF